MLYKMRTKSVAAIIVFIYIFEPCGILAKSAEFVSIECRHNPKQFSVFNLSIVKGKLCGDVRIKTNIVKGFNIYTNFSLRLPKTKKFNNFINYNADVCRTLMSPRNSLNKKWLLSFIKFGNLSDKCPFLADNYYVKDWTIEDGIIPGLILSGDYRVEFSGYYGPLKANSDSVILHCELILRLF